MKHKKNTISRVLKSVENNLKFFFLYIFLDDWFFFSDNTKECTYIQRVVKSSWKSFYFIFLCNRKEKGKKYFPSKHCVKKQIYYYNSFNYLIIFIYWLHAYISVRLFLTVEFFLLVEKCCFNWSCIYAE